VKNNFILLSALIFFTEGYAQSIKHDGTLPPDSAVLKLLAAYGEVFNIRDVAERDVKRKELVSPAYFYHGVDGAPISLSGLTKRQTNNKFKVLADSVYDEVLYQYENTAILIFKEWQHLMDKGVEKKGVNSVLIVLGKENGKWVVIADIIGMKPTSPELTKKK
jgi:hypothetical protein